MIITYHREKLINAIIYFAKNTKYCGKTKLMKLLYFLDFMHFKKTGKSVTGLEYFAWEMGPVPKDLFEELSDMKLDMKNAIKELSLNSDFQQIIPKKPFEADYFSKNEIIILKNIAFIFNDAKADVMVESTHLKNEPWDKTLNEKGKFQKIDYLLAIDSDIISLKLDEARERMEEISEVHKLFGVK